MPLRIKAAKSEKVRGRLQRKRVDQAVSMNLAGGAWGNEREVGMLPLILTVLSRDYSTPYYNPY